MVEEEKQSNELPRIRTYAADMSKVIKARGETLTSIVNKERTAAHGKTQEKASSKPRSYRSWLIGIGIGVFILAGVGVLIGVFVFSPNGENAEQNQSIIFANKKVTVPTSGDKPLIEELATVRQEYTFSLGEILHTIPTENEIPLSGVEVARRLNLPPALVREVTEVMVGIHSFDRNQPFIILRLAVYDRSFAALLGWESQMGRNLGAFFAPLNSNGSDAPLLTFNDSIIQNLDTRLSQSEWQILYAFPEQRLVVITTNEFTMREILTRLGSARITF